MIPTPQPTESLQQEVDALVSELDRIAEKTTFNNQSILDGSFIGAKFHTGANANDTVSVSIGDARSSSLGSQVRVSSSTNIAVTGAGDAIADDDVALNGVTIRATTDADDNLSTTNMHRQPSRRRPRSMMRPSSRAFERSSKVRWSPQAHIAAVTPTLPTT